MKDGGNQFGTKKLPKDCGPTPSKEVIARFGGGSSAPKEELNGACFGVRCGYDLQEIQFGRSRKDVNRFVDSESQDSHRGC